MTSGLPPRELSPETIDVVRSHMLGAPHDFMSVTGLVTIDTDSSLFTAPMEQIRRHIRYPNYPSTDTTFSGQMKLLFTRQFMTAEPRKLPDVYLFTAYSALPVAAAVQGFYRELHIPVPTLGAIITRPDGMHIEAACKYNEGDHYSYGKIVPSKLSVEGKTVCVVDQYVNAGYTLSRSSSYLLHSRGAERLYLMRGKWFEDAHSQNPSIDSLTSDVDNLMTDIGRAAARLSGLTRRR